MGYYKFEGNLNIISQYKNYMDLSVVAPFEVRIRNEPVISSVFIIGIAGAVYYLHKKGICADGINIKKILIDGNTFHPVLIEYGNPELMHKTMDDDEKELLELCIDYFPHTFKNIDPPVSEKILNGEIKLMESADVEDYRQSLLDKIAESESLQFDLSKFSEKIETRQNKDMSNNKEKSDDNEMFDEFDMFNEDEEKNNNDQILTENQNVNEDGIFSFDDLFNEEQTKNEDKNDNDNGKHFI